MGTTLMLGSRCGGGFSETARASQLRIVHHENICEHAYRKLVPGMRDQS